MNKKSDLLSLFLAMPVIKLILKPKLSDFLLDLHRSLAHQGSPKILDISTGIPAVFANPYASRSQRISSQKIAQLRLNFATTSQNGGFRPIYQFAAPSMKLGKPTLIVGLGDRVGHGA